MSTVYLLLTYLLLTTWRVYDTPTSRKIKNTHRSYMYLLQIIRICRVRRVIIYINCPLRSYDLRKRIVEIFLLGWGGWFYGRVPTLRRYSRHRPETPKFFRSFLVSSRAVVLEKRSVLIIEPWHFNYLLAIWLLLIYKLPLH